MSVRVALLSLLLLVPATALAEPMAPPSRIAPRDAGPSGHEGRAAAEARRSAIRPASRIDGWEGQLGLDRTLRLLEAAESVEGIKALRRGMAGVPDGDPIGRFGGRSPGIPVDSAHP